MCCNCGSNAGLVGASLAQPVQPGTTPRPLVTYNRPVLLPLLPPPVRRLHQAYLSFKKLGGFEPQRPLSVKEMLEQQTQQLQQCIQQAGLAITAAAAGQLNWEGFQQVRQQSATAAAATQQDGSTSAADQLQQLLADLTEVCITESPQRREELLAGLHQRVAATAAGTAAAQEGMQANNSNPAAAQHAAQQRQQQQAGPQQHPPGLGRSSSPDVAVTYMVDAPEEKFTTPSGRSHAAGAVASRSALALTPGGTHHPAFFVGSAEQPGSSSAAAAGMQAPSQPPAGVPAAEWQQFQQFQQFLMQKQQQQQQHTAQQRQLPAPSGAFGSSIYQAMCGDDPLQAMLQPTISTNAVAAAALGASGAVSGGHYQGVGPVAAAALTEVQQQLAGMEDRIAGRLAQMLRASGAGGSGLPPADGSTQQQQQHAELQFGSSSDAGPTGAAPAAGAALPRIRAFPVMSSFTTVVELARWYAVTPHPSREAQGRTPQQMEAGNETAWRKGNPPQRWWEYTVLLSTIEAKQVELTTSTQRPADFMAAAAAVDTHRQSLSDPKSTKGQCLTVCKYCKWLINKAKADAAAEAADVAAGDA